MDRQFKRASTFNQLRILTATMTTWETQSSADLLTLPQRPSVAVTLPRLCRMYRYLTQKWKPAVTLWHSPSWLQKSNTFMKEQALRIQANAARSAHQLQDSIGKKILLD